MTRKNELLEAVRNEPTLTGLVKNMVYLEGELDKLRKLPLIVVNKSDPTLQKATTAGKMYPVLLHKYTNVVKTVECSLGADASEEDSPLRKWLREHGDD